MNKRFCMILGILTGILAAESSFGSSFILPNADVFCETSSDGLTTTTYNGYDTGQVNNQVVFGLAAANGVSTGRRRSYIEFTIGSEAVSSATFWIYNYWGANMGGQGNAAGNGSLRLRATPTGTPITITEPLSPVVTDWVAPADTSFTSTITTINVTTTGWYSIDVTAWYNARLGQTTTLALRGQQVSGYDFPIYEDREGSAYANGADNTIANSGPRLEIVAVPEPSAIALLAVGSLLCYFRRR